jgi:hypothetical protein
MVGGLDMHPIGNDDRFLGLPDKPREVAFSAMTMLSGGAIRMQSTVGSPFWGNRAP